MWWMVVPPAMAATIPTTIGDAPVLRELNAALLGTSPAPRLSLIPSSCTRTVLLLLRRVPARVPMSSAVPASGDGEGERAGEGNAAAAVTAVVVTALGVNIVSTPNGIGIIAIAPLSIIVAATTITVADGDVSMASGSNVG